MSDWQPIHTLPWDEYRQDFGLDKLLLASDGRRVAVAEVDDHRDILLDAVNHDGAWPGPLPFVASHWMPLPEPPKP